ncbi:hypothetical protein TI03_07365, partial [Achromatium sp. WMS1]
MSKTDLLNTLPSANPISLSPSFNLSVGKSLLPSISLRAKRTIVAYYIDLKFLKLMQWSWLKLMSFFLKTKNLFLVVFFFGMSTIAHGQEKSFVIQDIRVEGLRRISIGTVFNYLPIKIGDTIRHGNTAHLIQTLYQTGFFKEISLEQDNNVLVIKLVERPAIGRIDIDGNKDFPTDKLKEGLKDIGLAEGRVFNRSVLDKIG